MYRVGIVRMRDGVLIRKRQRPGGYPRVGQRSKRVLVRRPTRTVMVMQGETGHVATEITKDVIALFREGDFVNGMADVTRFQQVAGVFACFPPVSEALHAMIQPIYHI